MKPRLHSAVRYGAMSYPDSGKDSTTVKLTEQITQLQQVQQTTVSDIQSSVDCKTQELLEKISTIDKAQTDAIQTLVRENSHMKQAMEEMKRSFADTVARLTDDYKRQLGDTTSRLSNDHSRQLADVQSRVDQSTRALVAQQQQKIDSLISQFSSVESKVDQSTKVLISQQQQKIDSLISQLSALQSKFNAIQSSQGEYKLSTAYIGSDGYKATIPKQVDGSQVSLAVEGKVIISNPDVVDKAQVNSKQTGLLYKPVMWNAATQSLCIVP